MRRINFGAAWAYSLKSRLTGQITNRIIESMIIPIKKLHPAAQLPRQANPGDAGLDLYSTEEVSLKPGERMLIGTGISVALPPGYFARICDRSGLAVKHGLHCLAGICDETYRGEYKVCLINLGHHEVTLLAGQRIAQMIIEKCYDTKWQEVDTLPDSQRGENGFGSSGV